MTSALRCFSAPQIDYELALEETQVKLNSTLYIEVDYSGIPKPSVSKQLLAMRAQHVQLHVYHIHVITAFNGVQQITWYHGDSEVEESARSTVEDNEDWCYLKRKHMKASDAGVYRVRAQNAAGVDEASFNVTVQGIRTSLDAHFLLFILLYCCSIQVCPRHPGTCARSRWTRTSWCWSGTSRRAMEEWRSSSSSSRKVFPVSCVCYNHVSRGSVLCLSR